MFLLHILVVHLFPCLTLLLYVHEVGIGLAGWLDGWLVGWLVGCLAGWLTAKRRSAM